MDDLLGWSFQFVYLMQADGGLFKVGFSYDPLKRLKTIARQEGRPLRLVDVCPGNR
jgi:hypothetical protein